MASTNVPLDQISPDFAGQSAGGNFGFNAPNPTGDILPTIEPKSFSNANFNAESMIGERLYTVMPRSAATYYSAGGLNQYVTDRGKVASLRLLSSDHATSAALRQGKSINLDAEMNTLLNDAEGYKNFFLTDVAVNYSEKVQVTQTFGDSEVAFYFGRQPVVFNISGMLMDSLYSDWFTKFIALYQTTLRGSVLAKQFELIELILPNMKLIGSIMGLSHQQNSARDQDIYFNFQFLAKEVVPIAIPELEGNMTNISGELLDFSVGKEGVGGFGYKLSSGIGGGLSMGTEYSVFRNAESNMTDLMKKAMGIGDDFGQALSSFRSSIFSPIYGIISSITRIIKTATGDISKVIKSFTDPVNLILKDIMYVATKAVAIANLIESSVNDIVSIPDRVIQNARNTLHSLQNASGVISRVPESVSEVFKRHFKNGRIKKGAAILSSGKNNKKEKGAVLSSGAPYSPTTAYKL